MGRSIPFVGGCCALILAFCYTPSTHAAFILGNSQAVNNDGQLYAYDATVVYSLGITVGTEPVTLTELTLRLAANINPVSASIQLRTDPDVAGSVLANQTVTSNTVQNTLFNLTPVQLSAGTTYWLTISTNASGAGEGLVLAANTPDQLPGGSTYATFAGLRSGLSGGASTLLPANFFPTPTLVLSGVVAVPEPTSLGLTALLALAAGRRILRNRKAL